MDDIKNLLQKRIRKGHSQPVLRFDNSVMTFDSTLPEGRALNNAVHILIETHEDDMYR